MQLKSIHLRNFKCFESIGIECSKFTLLTGANSSGKSSILYSVLGAVQTKNFPFYYSPNGSYVNMGDFVELAFNHKKTEPIGIKLTFADSDPQIPPSVFDCTFTLNRQTNLPKLSRLDFRSRAFELSIRKNGNYVGRYRYFPDRDANSWRQSGEFKDVLRSLMNMGQEALRKRDIGTRKKIAARRRSADKYLKQLFEIRGEETFKFRGSADLYRKLAERPFLQQQIWDITSSVVSFEESFNYVSSFRLPPERTYYERTKAALKVERFGENWVEQIVEWETAKSKKLNRVKTAGRQLGLFDDLLSARYLGGRYEIRVRPHQGCVDSSLVDVGFGISQFLPILVADAQLGKASMLFVSQPEIHLHPSVQADFANYLVEAHTEQRKRYVIETHSEYLLNRFRLLIADGTLKEEDVAVYYLNRVRGKPECHRLTFTADGKIQGAPKEFFDTYMMDVMQIAKHA